MLSLINDNKCTWAKIKRLIKLQITYQIYPFNFVSDPRIPGQPAFHDSCPAYEHPWYLSPPCRASSISEGLTEPGSKPVRCRPDRRLVTRTACPHLRGSISRRGRMCSRQSGWNFIRIWLLRDSCRKWFRKIYNTLDNYFQQGIPFVIIWWKPGYKIVRKIAIIVGPFLGLLWANLA